MRICEKCGQNPADIHIRQIINNEESELYICSKCAEKMQKKILSFLKMNNFITGMMQQVEPEDEEKVCPLCKFDIDKIRKLGKVGCAKCYDVFASELTPIMNKMNINRAIKEKNNTIKNEIDSLQEKLNEAVAKEEYEKAAELRDKIAELKGEKHDSVAKSRS
jgi:protein arginine kinase activator